MSSEARASFNVGADVSIGSTDKSITATLPPILSFSAQPDFTKYDICLLLASAHPTPLDLTKLVPVNDGPKEGETIRPRDCWMSNVSARFELGRERRLTPAFAGRDRGD